MTNTTGSAQQRDQPTPTAAGLAIAAKVGQLVRQIDTGQAHDAVVTIDDIRGDLYRLRAELVARNVRDQADAIARVQERYR